MTVGPSCSSVSRLFIILALWINFRVDVAPRKENISGPIEGFVAHGDPAPPMQDSDHACFPERWLIDTLPDQYKDVITPSCSQLCAGFSVSHDYPVMVITRSP